MRITLVDCAACACLLMFCAAASGGQKWHAVDIGKLTGADAQQLLNDSPWAVAAGAEIVTPKLEPRDKDIPLPTPANQPAAGPSYATDGYGVDDGKWDGGIGKIRHGEPPKIPVLLRWDSALPVRAALVKAHDPAAHDTEHSLLEPEKDYIVEVIGLIPAQKMDPPPGSGDAAQSAPVFDLNQLRNGVANSTRLLRRGKSPITPEDVHFDEATGVLRIYFPKKDPIVHGDKDIVFRTSFGTLQVIQKFRLRDMVYKGRLDL